MEYTRVIAAWAANERIPQFEMNEKKKYIWPALAVLTTLLIWGNSVVPAAQSSQMSGGLTAWLQEALHLSLSEHLIRKLGHFCEYALLGAEYALCMAKKRRSAQSIANCLALGLATAVTDESIQILSGRGPMVSDILLDFCGFITGFLLGLLIGSLVRWKKRT